MCLFYDGIPEGSTESGFMEKPGIEPATSGLQDICNRFIPYTTAAILCSIAGLSMFKLAVPLFYFTLRLNR